MDVYNHKSPHTCIASYEYRCFKFIYVSNIYQYPCTVTFRRLSIEVYLVALCVLHLTAFLQIPKRINWEEYISEGSDQWESQMAVSRLFDERPIWTKHSLNERLTDHGFALGPHMLRRWCLVLCCARRNS